MFPRLKQRFGTAVLDRVDLLVELSTLGEYGLGDDGLPVRAGSESRSGPGGPPVGPRLDTARRSAVVRPRDDCPVSCAPTPRRCEPPSRL